MMTHSKERIRIYTNVRHNLELARKIYEKHLHDGEQSLLCSMEGFSWDATGPKIGFCIEKHNEAIGLSKATEEVYRQRDAALAEITDIIRASKSILKSNRCVSADKLHEWAFVLYDNKSVGEKMLI